MIDQRPIIGIEKCAPIMFEMKIILNATQCEREMHAHRLCCWSSLVKLSVLSTENNFLVFSRNLLQNAQYPLGKNGQKQ